MLYLYITLFPLPRVESQAVVVAAKGNCRTFGEIKDLTRGMDGQLPFLLLSLPLPSPLIQAKTRKWADEEVDKSDNQAEKQGKIKGEKIKQEKKRKR